MFAPKDTLPWTGYVWPALLFAQSSAGGVCEDGDEKDNKKRAADSNAKPEPVKPAKKPKPAKKTKKDKKNDEELVEDTDSASEWVDLLRLLNWPIWVAAGVSLRPFRRFWQDFKFHWLISSHFWLGQFDLAI